MVIDYLKNTLYEEVYNLVKEGNTQLWLTRNNDKKEKRKFFIKDDILAIKRKRSQRWGDDFRHYYNDFKAVNLVKTSSDREKWEKSLKKGLEMLKKSGLWEDFQEDIQKVLDIGWDKLKEYQKIENTKFDEDYTKNQEIRLQKIKELDLRFIKIDDDKKEYLNCNILYHLQYGLRIKKMYFGKYQNEKILGRIKEAMQNKKSIIESARTNYDVSFEYNPEKNLAWYSEEYKGCGNGHYYLALNETHAFFYEDD